MNHKLTPAEKEIIPTELEERIIAHLSQFGKSDLGQLQKALGYPRIEYGNLPDSNPVNRALVSLRESGRITVKDFQWGDPIFYI